MSTLAVETFGLTRAFSARSGVWDLALKVPQQSIYAFLGPNGAGKTTTIRLLLGLLRPDSGSIAINGQPRNAQSRQRWIGSMVEGPSLYPHLSGRDNLAITAGMLGCHRGEIDRVLRIVGLQDADRQLTGRYSLGMRQRLGIALALLGEPELLILDEPGNGLDPAGMADVRRLIHSLVNDHGMTVFLSSHLLDDVEKIATHLGLLNAGRLVAQGDLPSLRDQHVKLRCSNPDTALQVLENGGYSASAENDGSLRIDTAADNAASINRLLVTSGFDVSELRTSAWSLEQYFARMTGAEAAA